MPEFGKLGKNLVVTGWVRTLRVQSTVTFIEVNDGSCLSNMQCIMDSDAEGYDQVIVDEPSYFVEFVFKANVHRKKKPAQIKG
ncbi:hypothetical protein ACLB2K_059042 [Fragaria x ananassa]